MPPAVTSQVQQTTTPSQPTMAKRRHPRPPSLLLVPRRPPAASHLASWCPPWPPRPTSARAAERVASPPQQPQRLAAPQAASGDHAQRVQPQGGLQRAARAATRDSSKSPRARASWIRPWMCTGSTLPSAQAHTAVTISGWRGTGHQQRWEGQCVCVWGHGAPSPALSVLG